MFGQCPCIVCFGSSRIFSPKNHFKYRIDPLYIWSASVYSYHRNTYIDKFTLNIHSLKSKKSWIFKHLWALFNWKSQHLLTAFTIQIVCIIFLITPTSWIACQCSLVNLMDLERGCYSLLASEKLFKCILRNDIRWIRTMVAERYYFYFKSRFIEVNWIIKYVGHLFIVGTCWCSRYYRIS